MNLYVAYGGWKVERKAWEELSLKSMRGGVMILVPSFTYCLHKVTLELVVPLEI